MKDDYSRRGRFFGKKTRGHRSSDGNRKNFRLHGPGGYFGRAERGKGHDFHQHETLQDQIEKKDVPRIREMLAPSGLSGFRFSKLKGRSNYASLLKLSEFSERESFTEEEALFFAKVCAYLSKNPSGELDDLPVFGKDYELISEIHSGDSRVLSPDNSYRKQEFLFKAREAVKTADVILVNHALLLTEIGDDAPGSIGKLSRLVVDEAHNLEAAATDALLRTFALTDAEKTFSHIEASIRRHNRTPAVEKFLFPELREISDSFVLSFGMALELSERYAFSKAGSSHDRNTERGEVPTFSSLRIFSRSKGFPVPIRSSPRSWKKSKTFPTASTAPRKNSSKPLKRPFPNFRRSPYFWRNFSRLRETTS
jgi:hypothetical protein